VRACVRACVCQAHSHVVGEVAKLEAVQQEVQVSQLGETGGQRGQRGDMMTDLTTQHSLSPVLSSTRHESSKVLER